MTRPSTRTTSVGRAFSPLTRPRGRVVGPEEMRAKIQKKAYELYEKRGYSSGNDFSDWLEAEQLVKMELSRG
ncbi:MAG: DUF2934 domain-containing protein [Candidatus Omnitrophota bacterium]